MEYQATFRRYENKYLLTLRQKEQILQVMEPYMKLDGYGRTVIRNIYFDTSGFRLVRRSLKKPACKEKLRIRSYQTAVDNDPVFVELKKQYKSVVCKQRLALPEAQAMNGKPFIYWMGEISRSLLMRTSFTAITISASEAKCTERHCLRMAPNIDGDQNGMWPAVLDMPRT